MTPPPVSTAGTPGGGEWRAAELRGDVEYWCFGSFHGIGGGRIRRISPSPVENMDGRDAWLRTGMEVGIDKGRAKLDRLLSELRPREPPSRCRLSWSGGEAGRPESAGRRCA